MKISGQLDRTIEPGKTDNIEVTLNLGQRAGVISRTVQGESNDRDAPKFALECAADMRVALNIEPIAVNFGNISRTAEAQTKVLAVTRGNGGPISPKVTNTGNEQITAEVTEIEAGERYEVKVTANPPWPNDMLNGKLVLETGVEQSPSEDVTVYLRITPRLATAPNSFRIPFDVKSDLVLDAQLQWADGSPGKILEAAVNDPNLTVEVKEDGDQQKIALHVPAGYAFVQNKKLFVTLKTDDPAALSVQVPVYAMRNPAARDPAVLGISADPKKQ